MTTATPELARLNDRKALSRYARTGDPRAFEVLTHRYQGMVLATCRRTLRDLADAEDAAQETFLKLARNAAKVRSNVAAWLHATAHRTAIDLLRTQQSQARAERAAAEAGSADATPEEQAWKDLEPELDAALKKLDPDDREIIVARFLAGRPVTELAKAAGVNKGTMSRRLDKAIKNLRGSLESKGFVLSAGVSLPTVLMCAQAEAGPALSLMLGKVGLAGMTSCGKPAFLAGLLSPAVLAASLGVTVVAGSAITLGTLNSSGSATSGGASQSSINLSLQQPATAPERPARTIDGLTMTGVFPSAHFEDGIVFSRNNVVLTSRDGYAGDRVAMDLSITTLEPKEPGANRGELQLRVQRVRASKPGTFEDFVGLDYLGTYQIDDFGRLVINATINAPEGPQSIEWIGIRPPADHPLRADLPDNLGPTGLNGPWMEFSDWGFRLDADNIAITSGDYDIHRFRILEWETAGDHARVQTICADSMAPGMVGERVKLLLRQDANGYTIVYNERNWNKLNQWPSGFNPDPRNQDDNGLLVRSFQEVK